MAQGTVQWVQNKVQSVWFSYLCLRHLWLRQEGESLNLSEPVWPRQPSGDGGAGLKVKWVYLSAQSTAVGIRPGKWPAGTSWLSERYHFAQHARANANLLPGPAPRPAAPSLFHKANMQPDSRIHAHRNAHLILMLTSLNIRLCYSGSHSTQVPPKQSRNLFLFFMAHLLRTFWQWQL